MMKKLIAIILAGMMIVTLFGCGEQETVSVSSTEQTADNSPQAAKVTFSAKSGAQDKVLNATTGDVYDWYEFNDDVLLDKKPVRGIEELKGKQVKYNLTGVEDTFTYVNSMLYPDCTSMHWYRASDKREVAFNEDNEFCGFACLGEGLDKYNATTKEQREYIARQVVKEYFDIDTAEWVYTERVTTYACCYLRHSLDSKKLIERFIIVFGEEGDLKNCYLDGSGKLRNINEYPIFDRDECYKVAEAKLMENLEMYKRAVSYGYVEGTERYWMIGDKYYYKFRFAIDEARIEGTEHQLITDQEKLNNSYDCVVEIYVELITE